MCMAGTRERRKWSTKEAASQSLEVLSLQGHFLIGSAERLARIPRAMPPVRHAGAIELSRSLSAC